nr:lipopolysaccharide transport periplasmic protein LptA [Desulfuromonadales bacterium]NIR34267.1 lipopolysaccharide transport periplasmic protein LptA [Desulfuromonadales bacterium]NIS42845.1 lipopolysaccharide transport periplasmic protein LptA [Desulfuromonadales bacterium]
AQQQGEAEDPVDRGPIRVRSDRLEAEQQMNRVTFSGSVVAEQGGVTIYADKLILHYRGDSREIEKVESFGDVRIVQGERVATSQKAIYRSDEGRIVLTGSPKVHQGQSFIEGDEIIFLLDEEKSLVKGKEGRVNAVFQSGGDEK